MTCGVLLSQTFLVLWVNFHNHDKGMFKLSSSRKYLSARGLLDVAYAQFKKIKPPRELARRSNPITLTDCLMSGVALFGLKFPSLLKFSECKEERELKHNLRTLYHVEQAPSDTYMRERCDEVLPSEVRKVFKSVLSCVQRGKGLEDFRYIDDHYLVAGDGTGFFSSNSVHCKNCCVKHYNQCHIKFQGYFPEDLSGYKKNTYVLVKNARQAWELYFIDHERHRMALALGAVDGLQEILQDKARSQLSKAEKEQTKQLITAHYQSLHPEETVNYYHNMFCAAIVHPDNRIALPLAPEPIMKADGATKNDCERNAAKRLYTDARREHPHLKLIIVEDSLASNVPHLTDLRTLNMRYIVGAKPGDHKFLFQLIEQTPGEEYTHQTSDGTTHRYRYNNQVQLNNSHPDFKVNFLEYWEVDKKGKEQHFCWVTDLTITNDNVYLIMRGGRINWRIENNTFNTLKNQDYHFSHNFGHGYENLCSVFGMLMMLAFFIDQAQELFCQKFKAARAKFKSRTSLWEKMRGMCKEYLIVSWDDLFDAIAYGYNKTFLLPNTT
jgi:hypothetical protein